MKFSVLISVYHKEQGEFLRLSLDSVMDQTLIPNEVILVKDGPLTSELDAVCDEFVGRYPEIIKIVALAENVGLGKALNEGLKHCSYDLVARMDSDDICKPHRFEKQIAVFEAKPEVSVVGSWVDEFEDNADNIISVRKLPQDDFELKRYASKRSPFNHPTVMFKKQEVLAVDGYPPIHRMQDFYLWLKMKKAGSCFFNIQESLIFFRTSLDLMVRRGGFKYASKEIQLFNAMRRNRLISRSDYIRNILIRFPIRIMPAFIRGYIYKKMLR